MLATRIIPTLLVRNGQLVKGKQFNSWRTVGIPAQAMRIYAARGVDELVLLDIGATPEGRGPDFDMVRSVTDGLFCPIAVGGGVKTLNDIEMLLRNGADKVVIGGAAYVHPNLIRTAAKHFGSQAICVALDYVSYQEPSEYGRRLSLNIAAQVAKALEDLGTGEIILTDKKRDGMMNGYDLLNISQVSMAVKIPVIASGGCGTYEHMLEAIQAGASAVAASSMFLFTDNTPKGAAEYLSKKGIQVRL